MICEKCGTQNEEVFTFCKNCGAPLEHSAVSEQPVAEADPVVNPQPTVTPQPTVNPQPNYSQQAPYPQNGMANRQPAPGMQNNGAMVPDGYQPITMWGYFGYELLFSIPCVGFILLLVFSFGGTKNKNLQNFARSFFCWIIISVVLTIIIFIIAAISGVAISSAYNF